MQNKKNPRNLIFPILLICTIFGSFGEGTSIPYPEIKRLHTEDPLFAQLSQDIAAYHKAHANGEELPALLLYRYTVKEGEDLYAIAARTNIGIDAVVTLNSLDNPKSLTEGREILLPNMPGIFMAHSPISTLDRVVSSLRDQKSHSGDDIVVGYGIPRKYSFFPGEKMSQLERAYFLNILFRFPLREGSISSEFGARDHPFSGQASFHAGVDLAAPRGSEVLAARNGDVAETGFDEELGNYIVINHGGGFSTVYGHLDSVLITLRDTVKSGSIIGTVGSTGLSTGPHLHFEVRNEGDPRNPLPMIRGNGE